MTAGSITTKSTDSENQISKIILSKKVHTRLKKATEKGQKRGRFFVENLFA
jgi:hypothetical protein